MNCCYIFTILCAITILALFFITSIEALENGGETKTTNGQFDTFRQAVNEAKQNLNTIVKPMGHVDETLLRQRRQTIDEMLTNFQIDAENEALKENDNEILDRDDSDDGGGDGMDQNWLRQARSEDGDGDEDNDMSMWNKRHLKTCAGDSKCRVGNQDRFKSNPPLSEYKSLENFLSQTKLDANDILNSGISSYANDEKSGNKENGRKQENNNMGRNGGNRGGNNDKPYHNELLVAFNNRYNKPSGRASAKNEANKKNNDDFKFLEHNYFNNRDHFTKSDSESTKSQKQFSDSGTDYSETSNTNNKYSTQNNDDNSNNNNKGSHSHHANYKPMNEETLNYLNKHHMKFDLGQTTAAPLKVKEIKEEDEDDLYAFKYPVGILRGTELESKDNTILTATVKPNLDYKSDLYEANIQQKPQQSMETSLWGESDDSPANINDDQLDNTQNNLSHEANYKLSKVEQDASEKKKEFKWKWGNVKRAIRFNPMDEIKLKTSSRLMTKGFGPSLPSYSLGEARRDIMIENVLKRKEKQLERINKKNNYDSSQPMYGKPNYEELMERNKRLESFVREPYYPVLMPMSTNNWNYIRRKRISESTKTEAEKLAELKEINKDDGIEKAKDEAELKAEPLKSLENAKELTNGPDKALKELETVEKLKASPEDDGKLLENTDNLSKDQAQSVKLEKDSDSVDSLKDENGNDLEKDIKQEAKITQKREEMILKMDINPDLKKDTNYHLRRKRSVDKDSKELSSLSPFNDLTSLKVLKRVKRYQPNLALDLKIYQKFHSPRALELNRFKSYQGKQNRNTRMKYKAHTKINRNRRSCNENNERVVEENQLETLKNKKNESKSSEYTSKEKESLKASESNENHEQVNKTDKENKMEILKNLKDSNLQSFTQKIWQNVKAFAKRLKAFVKAVTSKFNLAKLDNTTLSLKANEISINTSFSKEDQIPENILHKEDQSDEKSLEENMVYFNLIESSSKKSLNNAKFILKEDQGDRENLNENMVNFNLIESSTKKILNNEKFVYETGILTEGKRQNADKLSFLTKSFKNSTIFQMAKRPKRSLEFAEALDFDNFELNEDDFINSIDRAGFKRTRRSINSNNKENPTNQRLTKRNIHDIDEIFKPKFDMNYLNMEPQRSNQNFEDFKPRQDFDFYHDTGKEKYPQDIYPKADTDFNFYNKKRQTNTMDNNDLDILPTNGQQNTLTKPNFDLENIHAAFNKEKFDNMQQDSDPQLEKFEGMKFDNMWLENSKAKLAEHTKHTKLLLPILKARKALHKSFLKSQDQMRNTNKRHVPKTNLKTNLKTNSNHKNILKPLTGASSLDKSANKLKHNNLNNIQNSNQNYKFNENHYNWRHQPNIRHWLNSMNQEIEDSKNSDEANKLILSGRNEILNCKAFASLENFLKSLPKNVSLEMTGGNRETETDNHNSDNQNSDNQNSDNQNSDNQNSDNQNSDNQNSDNQNSENQNSENHNSEKDDIAAGPSETTTLCVPVSTTESPTTDDPCSTTKEPSTTTPLPIIDEATPIDCPDVSENPLPEINIETVEPKEETTTECIPQSPTSSEPSTTESTTTEPVESSTEITTTTLAYDSGDDVKLNITINANVHGNSKSKNFSGNGSFNVMPGYSDERKRRGIFSYPYDEMQKQRCALKPTVGPNDGDDNNGLSYLASGKLSANVVKNIFDMVRECPKLKVLWPSLKRNQLEAKPQVQNLYAIRNQDNESKVKESEQLLAKAMDSINAIIDEQVRSRTCVPLRPDLKEFYDLIIKSRQEQDKCRAKRDLAKAKTEEDFSAEVRLMDPNKIEEESKTVKKLLKQYEELPAEDQQEAAAVRDELLRDLSVLRKAKEFEDRRKRDVRERKELELDLSDQEVMKRLESQYTPQFLKLLKAADLYREITSDTEPQL